MNKKFTGGFEFGYQQEQGRLKAQQEEQQKRIREEEKKQERMKFCIRGKKERRLFSLMVKIFAI